MAHSTSIQTLYDRYFIPPNLARHQREVAAVGAWILDHWNGPAIDKNVLTQALLLHDMGNIVKFKRPFLGEMGDKEAYWEEVQNQFQKKYGMHAHQATDAILREIGVNEKVLALVQEMSYSFDGLPEYATIAGMVADYCDLCVTPNGIEGYEKRERDLIDRYGIDEDSEKVRAWRKVAKEVTNFLTEKVDEQLGEIQKLVETFGQYPVVI